jgi:filamentous hemagglutinin family protein
MTAIAISLALSFAGRPILAAPLGGVVQAGAARIVQTTPTRLDIIQTTHRAIINWHSFGVAANEHVNFSQPSVQSAALNRVIGVDPSVILGRLSSNGTILLVNSNGVLFGPGSKIDVGSLIAATAGISNENFMAGRYRFDQVTNRFATVINRGEITAVDGGLVALVAPGVENTGVIRANLGRVALASGNAFTLDFFGDKLIALAIDDKVAEKLTDPEGRPLTAYVNQAGTIEANGGTVLLMAIAARAVLDHVINLSGTIQARSFAQHGGEIVLYGGDEGTVQVSGVADATGKRAGESGGKVSVLGENVQLASTAEINVSGDTGGGIALVGGDWQGSGTTPRATNATVEAGARISADALTSGNGGTVVVWSDGVTEYYGSISATGGRSRGDGGFVEVSGKAQLTFRGDADAHAPHGKPGTLLLDPRNLEVGPAGKTTLAGDTGNDGQAGVYAASEDAGSDATVQASTIENLLNSGTTVSLQASNDLTVNARIDGRGGRTGAGLTLGATNDVRINNDILTADGNVSIEAANGSIVMTSGPPSSITSGQGTVIATGAGTISLRAGGDVTVQHLLSSTGVEVTSASGKVDLAHGYGGTGANKFGQGSLIVAAANAVEVNGTIYAGGTVKLSGSDVVLRHSIFTNNQSIELGRAGGKVTLDPAGDETSTEVIRDARTALPVREPPINQTGTYTVSEANGTFTVGGASSMLSGPSGGSRSIPALTVEATTRRLSINSGNAGGNISFLGEVAINEDADKVNNDPHILERTAASLQPNQPGFPETKQVSGFYVLLDLTAGNGVIRFASPVARNAKGTPSVADDPNSNDQNTAGRTTLDLVVQSASKLIHDSPDIFVNSVQLKSPATVLEGGAIQPIFRQPINVEAFTVDQNDGTLNSAGLPPIFPEPNLGAAFSSNSTTMGFSLPNTLVLPGGGGIGGGGVGGSIGVGSGIGGGVAGVINAGQDAAQSQAASLTVGFEREEPLPVDRGVARMADMGRQQQSSGAAPDVFSESASLIANRDELPAGADPDYFGHGVFDQRDTDPKRKRKLNP